MRTLRSAARPPKKPSTVSPTRTVNTDAAGDAASTIISRDTLPSSEEASASTAPPKALELAGGNATKKKYFYETGDGRPTQSEVFLLAVVIIERSGASVEPEALHTWAQTMVALSDDNYFDPNWVPSDHYNTGKGREHPAIAQGLDYLAGRHGETTKAIHLALAECGHVLTNGETKYYFGRLKAKPRSTKPKPLTTNGIPRIKYVLTEVAYFLVDNSNIAAMVQRLDLAHGRIPLGDKEISGKKGDYKRESFEKGIEIEQMKQGVENLTAEFEEKAEISARDQVEKLDALRDEIRELRDEVRGRDKKMRDRDKKTKKRRAQRQARRKDQTRKRDSAFKEALAEASGKLEQRARKRMKVMEKTIENIAEAKRAIADLTNELLRVENESAELEETVTDLNRQQSEMEKEIVDLRAKISKIKVFQYEQMHCPNWMRIMIYEIIVAGAPPSGVDGIVRSVLKHVVPFLKVKMPTDATIMNMRIEIGLVSDSMNALVLARCKRIIQLGHDGTDVNGIAVLAANMVVELVNGDQTEVMLRGCFVAKGKTSQLELESVLSALQRFKDLLTKWQETHTTMFPGEDSGIPHPDGIDFKKLLSGSLMSDNAAAALKTSKLIVEHVVSEVDEMIMESSEGMTNEDFDGLPEHIRDRLTSEGIGLPQLSEMDDDELLEFFKPLVLTCARHTSNLLVDVGAKAEHKYLKVALGTYTEVFTSFDRVTPDITSLLRACGKEFDFRSQSTYPKGDAVTYFLHWLQKEHPTRLVLNSFRAMLGGRQDHKLAAALELWWNRDLFVDFLVARAAQEKNVSTLRSAIESSLNSVEVVGALIARSVIFVKTFEPLRFFSASNDLKDNEGWTSLNMAPVYEAVKKITDQAKSNGWLLVNADLDVFSSITSDEYEKYKRDALTDQKQLPNETNTAWRARVRAELYAPKDATNVVAMKDAVKLIEIWCEAISEACTTTAVKNYITGGELSTANQTQWMQRKAEGSHRNNDKLTESIFGMLKEYIQSHRGTTRAVAAGVIVARKGDIFGRDEDHTRLGTRKRRNGLPPLDSSASSPASHFRLDQLTDNQLTSLITMVRRNWKFFHMEDRRDEVEQRSLNFQRAEDAKAKLEKRLDDDMEKKWRLLRSVPRDDPDTLERTTERLITESKLNAKVIHKENKAIAYLWQQNQLYYFVFGLGNFKITKKGSSAADLKEHIITQLSTTAIPDEPAMSRIQSRAIKILGHPTRQYEAGSAARIVKALAAHRASRKKAADSLAAAAAAASNQGTRLRHRRKPGRVPCPVIDKRFIGKAIEFGFKWYEEHDGATSSTTTVRHLYGDIESVELRREKVSPSSRKTMTRALLFVRWDSRIYDESDEHSREWIEVLPKNYGSALKDGWEIVDARELEYEPVVMSESEGESSLSSENEEAAESEEATSSSGCSSESDDE